MAVCTKAMFNGSDLYLDQISVTLDFQTLPLQKSHAILIIYNKVCFINRHNTLWIYKMALPKTVWITFCFMLTYIKHTQQYILWVSSFPYLHGRADDSFHFSSLLGLWLQAPALFLPLLFFPFIFKWLIGLWGEYFGLNWIRRILLDTLT